MRLFSAPELASHLNVKVATVRFWQGQGIPCVPLGRLRRYRVEDVLEWLEQRNARSQTKRAEKKAAA